MNRWMSIIFYTTSIGMFLYYSIGEVTIHTLQDQIAWGMVALMNHLNFKGKQHD